MGRTEGKEVVEKGKWDVTNMWERKDETKKEKADE